MPPKIPLGESPIVWRGKDSFVVDTIGGYGYAHFSRGYLMLDEIHVKNNCASLSGSSDLPGADEAILAVMLYETRR